MDAATIDRLCEKSSPTEREILEELYKAWTDKFGVYKKDNSSTNLKEWTAVNNALNAKVAELSTKYNAAAPDSPPLPNRRAAHRFLQRIGYKISNGKFYKDCDNGLVRVFEDGALSENDVRAYAERYLEKIKSSPNDDGQLDALHKEKASAELSKVRAQEESLRFELELKREKYLPKDRVLTEFAVKWSEIDAAVRDLVRNRGRDWIYAVGGDVKKFDVLISMTDAELDDLFNSLATIEELNIRLNCDSDEND